MVNLLPLHFWRIIVKYQNRSGCSSLDILQVNFTEIRKIKNPSPGPLYIFQYSANSQHVVFADTANCLQERETGTNGVLTPFSTSYALMTIVHYRKLSLIRGEWIALSHENSVSRSTIILNPISMFFILPIKARKDSSIISSAILPTSLSGKRQTAFHCYVNTIKLRWYFFDKHESGQSERGRGASFHY